MLNRKDKSSMISITTYIYYDFGVSCQNEPKPSMIRKEYLNNLSRKKSE